MNNFRHMNFTISIVLPVFNEESNIKPFLEKSSFLCKKFGLLIEYLFVNDGSSDGTLDLLIEMQKSIAQIRIISLARNFGKEAALSAGLSQAKGDVIIPMDVDGQDPIDLVPLMLSEWENGYDVVLAKRADRTSDGFMKRLTAHLFYKVNSFFSDIRIPNNVGDFRLMDRKVVNAVLLLPESKRFMKGLFAWVGFKTKIIEYQRPPRHMGITKYNFKSLLNFGIDGITSFSILPVTCFLYIGALISFLSFLFGFVIIFRVIFYGVDTPGYASLMTAITFLGGIQLIGIGILGEYVGRTYIEAKRRPLFIIDKIYETK